MNKHNVFVEFSTDDSWVVEKLPGFIYVGNYSDQISFREWGKIETEMHIIRFLAYVRNQTLQCLRNENESSKEKESYERI